MSNIGTSEIALPASEETEQEIKAFLAGNDGSHYRQSFEWVRAAGERNFRLFVTRNEGIIIAVSFVETLRSRLPLVSDACIARGPVFSDERALVSHLADLEDELSRPFCALRISPFVPRASVSLPPSWQPVRNSGLYSSTLILDTRTTVGELWRQLRRSTRTSINKSRTAGLNIVNLRESSQIAEFVVRFNEFARRRGIAKIEDSVSSGLARFLANRTLLLEIRRGDKALAGALFLRNPKGFVYEWGWTAPVSERGNFPLMHRLIWEAIEYCRKENYTELDLGGYWVNRGPDDPINHFKLGFSKQRRDYAAEHEIILSPVRYETRQFLRKCFR